MAGMSTNTFPRARRSSKGYDILQVEDFLEDAKRAYSAPADAQVLTSKQIRNTAFLLKRGGYDTAAVDAALERLEDAFAERERAAAVATVGQAAYAQEIKSAAQEILDRVTRSPKRRFKRVSGFTLGYRVKDVDAFADRVAEYLQGRAALSPEEVRAVSFRVVHGGYREAQVDALLDALVEVMLGVR